MADVKICSFKCTGPLHISYIIISSCFIFFFLVPVRVVMHTLKVTSAKVIELLLLRVQSTRHGEKQDSGDSGDDRHGSIVPYKQRVVG